MTSNLPPFILSSYERKHLPAAVHKILRGHFGLKNAIRGSELAQILGHRDDRTIRLAIRELIREGIPIGASVVEPMGFYICEVEQEAQSYIRTLRSRAEEDLARLRDFEDAAGKYWAIPEQARML